MCLITAICGFVVLFCGMLASKTWLAVTDIVLALVDFFMAYRLYKTATDIAKAMDEYNDARENIIVRICSVIDTLALMHGINIVDKERTDSEEEESLEDFINKCNKNKQ